MIRIAIEKIKHSIQQGISDMLLQSPICSICLEDLRTGTKHFAVLACGHVNCEQCLDRLMRSNNVARNDAIRSGRNASHSDLCPSCRTPFGRNTNRRLFLTYRR